MKIRIQGNSIRLRLSQSEVDSFHQKGKVEAEVQFGILPDEKLTYSLEIADIEHISACYGDGIIRIFTPAAIGKEWASSNKVGIEHIQVLNDQHTLRILVEKDFKCLTARAGEDERDNFPNPNLSC